MHCHHPPHSVYSSCLRGHMGTGWGTRGAKGMGGGVCQAVLCQAVWTRKFRRPAEARGAEMDNRPHLPIAVKRRLGEPSVKPSIVTSFNHAGLAPRAILRSLPTLWAHLCCAPSRSLLFLLLHCLLLCVLFCVTLTGARGHAHNWRRYSNRLRSCFESRGKRPRRRVSEPDNGHAQAEDVR